MWWNRDTRPRNVISGRRRKYSCEELRAIRAEKGVGKRHVGKDRYAPNVDAWVRRCRQVNVMLNKSLSLKCRDFHLWTMAAADR
jgi:ribosomal protein L19E